MNDLNPSFNLQGHLRAWSYHALFLLAGLLAVTTPLRAANPPTYMVEIDLSAVAGGLAPNFLALDSSNNICVTDYGNSRVAKLAPDGTLLAFWSSPGSGNGQFAFPNGIALDSSNNVYVASSGNNCIVKFDANGNYLTQWGNFGSANGQFNNPIGVAVDANNNIYVVDQGNARVEKFGANGGYLTRWGGGGTGNGQFSSPQGITVDASNNVYVVDSGNYRVEKFGANGGFLAQWGGSGSGNGRFYNSGGIAVDANDNLYVADTGNYRVEEFGGNGGYLTQWGTLGSGNGQFDAPIGIALDSTGNIIYVADSPNYRIEVFANNTGIVPPFITRQPTNQTVPAGANVAFSVSVGGTAPFFYQWNSNNVVLSGATNAAFTLNNVALADSATYSVLVTNAYGAGVSSEAVLAVLPAVAITLPATGLSNTSAVLNGSITVGADQTSVWFEWGIDTNYGNTTDAALVAGNNESTNIVATLSGLPGNIYHYRIEATNDFGIAYGDDQSFLVGSAPTATTLSPLNGANGSTLNATVNPNAWDTKVFFRWGQVSLTYSTPATDIGAGAIPLNVSSLITGLVPASQYECQVVASNQLGITYGPQVAFYSPPFVGVPYENWNAVASSADGRVLVAVSNPGPIFISTNSGADWTQPTNAPIVRQESVACSADGSKIITAGGGGLSFVSAIYTSPDSGVTWVSNNAPVQNWQAVASSADGTKLVAADYADRVIYTSADSGITWTQATNAPKQYWYSVALSADGTKLAAVADAQFTGFGGTNIYTSTNFGMTWITNNAPKTPLTPIVARNWVSIASSADGSRLVAATGGNENSGFLFISTNYGAAWNATATNMIGGLVPHQWTCVASSADGSILAAVAADLNPLGIVITSTNSGATWFTNAVPFLDWNAVALSADGARMIASVGYPSTGPIYVSQTTPSPVLSLSTPDNVISWLIPSLDFTLQQSPDLTAWTDVTNQPVLNMATLQNQVILPSGDENNFFRLKH